MKQYIHVDFFLCFYNVDNGHSTMAVVIMPS